VDFVYDVEFEASRGRHRANRILQLSDCIDAVITGAIEFVNVETASTRNVFAIFAFVARNKVFAVTTSQAFCEKASTGSFAGSSRPGEE